MAGPPTVYDTRNGRSVLLSELLSEPGVVAPANDAWADTRALSSPGMAARRLVAARPLADISAVLTSPPTIADPASDGANSTIRTTATTAVGGGVSGNAENPLTCTLVGAPELVGNRPAVVTRQAGSRIGGHGSGIAVITNAPSIDFAIRCNGQRWIAYVTDVLTGERGRVAADDRPQAFANYNYYKLTFADARTRMVEVYTSSVGNLAGINVPTGYSVRPIALNQPRIGVIGDSFWEGTMNNTTQNLRLSVADWFAARLGCAFPIINGVGSTGVIANAGASNYNTFMQRLQAGDMGRSRVGDLDLLFLPGSVNDSNTSVGGLAIPAGDATLQAAYQAYVSLAMTEQPNAIIVGCGQEFSGGGQAVASRTAAYKAGFLAAAGSDRRMIFLDNNLFAAAPDTNVIGADNVHPGGVFGSQVIGYSLADDIRKVVASTFGL